MTACCCALVPILRTVTVALATAAPVLSSTLPPRLFSSSVKAARSAAEANRTWPSMANVASRRPALADPVMRSPTSLTSCAASASSQPADSRSGAFAGSGATAASAAGEITYDAAVDFHLHREVGEEDVSEIHNFLAFMPARWLQVDTYFSFSPQD